MYVFRSSWKLSMPFIYVTHIRFLLDSLSCRYKSIELPNGGSKCMLVATKGAPNLSKANGAFVLFDCDYVLCIFAFVL